MFSKGTFMNNISVNYYYIEFCLWKLIFLEFDFFDNMIIFLKIIFFRKLQ